MNEVPLSETIIFGNPFVKKVWRSFSISIDKSLLRVESVHQYIYCVHLLSMPANVPIFGGFPTFFGPFLDHFWGHAGKLARLRDVFSCDVLDLH